MKAKRYWISAIVLAMLAVPGVLYAQPPYPVGTAFTYQGRLMDDGRPADGEYDFEFKLYNDLIAGDQIGVTVIEENKQVDYGLFTVDLDFQAGLDDVFTGDARWLEIGVRPGDDTGPHTTLDPRQALTPAPYALYAETAGSPDGHSLDAADGSPTDAIYVDDEGKVGIGHTNPIYTVHMDSDDPSFAIVKHDIRTFILDVTGAVGQTDYLNINTTTATIASFGDNGNVGFGATTPSDRLVAKGASAGDNSVIVVEQDSDTDMAVSLGLVGTDDGILRLFDDSQEVDVYLRADGDSWFNGGNVGIGTASPSQSLDVNGNAIIQGQLDVDSHKVINVTDPTDPQDAATKYYVDSVVAAGDGDWMVSGNDMYSIPSGNVGIGTSAPDEKLCVKGNIKVGEAFSDDFPGTSLGSAWLEEDIGTGTVLSEVADSWWRLYGFGGGPLEWYGKRITYQPELSLPGDFAVDYKISATCGSYPTLGVTLHLTDSAESDVVRFGFQDSWRWELGEIKAYIQGETHSSPRDITEGTFTLRIAREAGTVTVYRDGDEFFSKAGVTDEITGLYIRIDSYPYDGYTPDEGKLDYVLIHGGGGVSVGGRVGIGTTSPSVELHVEGDICATGTIGVCSDVRFKKDIQQVMNPLTKIGQLRGVQFDWKTEEYPHRKFARKRQVGFIAQEIKSVLPEVVSQGSDGFYSVDYGRVVPVLVEAVKELHGVVKDKDAQLAAQHDLIAELTARLQKIEATMAELAGTQKGDKR